ncbi:hypothetical protein HOO65_010736 [Ceratocystis lukuohia]|uniref:DUF7598 domain-containing protein n=2 Tax=Ceratocystis TaxID=5157 RepID=A0A2C5XJ54_9PEZI|nr:hypothetical protein CFIMG_008525RA00001 [Ceratocystis fimbriata CBS 114723]
MVNVFENPGLCGSGHVVLNVLRAFTIIGLLCISASCWVMVVMTGKNGSFYFFDAISQIIASLVALCLITSEVGLFRDFYERNWPVISSNRGLTWLGSAITVLACHVLGQLNRPQLSQAAIGMPLWRLILASGILGLIFGIGNIAASVVFRDSEHQINARTIRSDGSLASNSVYAASSASSTHSDHVHNEKVSATRRWTQKLSPFNGGGRPKISHPYESSDVEAQRDSVDDRRSPIVPELLRPQTALHPMNTTNTGVSRYSVVSHMNRF